MSGRCAVGLAGRALHFSWDLLPSRAGDPIGALGFVHASLDGVVSLRQPPGVFRLARVVQHPGTTSGTGPPCCGVGAGALSARRVRRPGSFCGWSISRISFSKDCAGARAGSPLRTPAPTLGRTGSDSIRTPRTYRGKEWCCRASLQRPRALSFGPQSWAFAMSRPAPTIGIRPGGRYRPLVWAFAPDGPRSPRHVPLSPPSQAFARRGLASFRRSQRASRECSKTPRSRTGHGAHKKR